MIIYTPPIAYGGFLGISLGAALLNHGLTSDILKWTDRIVMTIGSGVTFYMAPTIILKIILCIVIFFYGLAKMFQNTTFHIIAHLLITIVNISILYYIYNKLDTITTANITP
jgi:hypothetical protein